MSTVQSLATDFVSWAFSTLNPIPLLNWNIGGMRIPITAEAVVRMQSPVQPGDLK
jgi:hypothetical protein